MCRRRGKIAEESYITGYHGCSCHPFKTWEESKFFHKQKLKVGDRVKNRHTGKIGYIAEVDNAEGNYYIVKFGTRGVSSDYELEHGAILIKIEDETN